MKSPSPITALACLTLAACSTTQPAVPIPANLTQPCPKLTPLAECADFGNLLEKAIEMAGMYHEVCIRQDALSKLVTR